MVPRAKGSVSFRRESSHVMLLGLALLLLLPLPANAYRGGARPPLPTPWMALDQGAASSRAETSDVDSNDASRSRALRSYFSDSTLERLTQALHALDVTYGVDWYRTRVSGNTTRAFRPQQTFQLHNATTGYKDRFGSVDADIQAALRWTDDITITRSRDYKLMSFSAQFDRANTWRLRFGDVFPNLSPYTYSRSARTGAHGWYAREVLGGTLKLTAVTGVTNREQEYTGRTEAGQYRRLASGGAIDWEGPGFGPLRRLKTGLRASSAHDDGSSISSRRTSGGAFIPRLDIDVYSFQYEAELPAGLTWRGENAYSDGNRDLTRGEVLQRTGTAHNTALDWSRPAAWGRPSAFARLLPIRMRADYEWVDPDFLTELGSASVDQMRWGTGADFRWNDNFDWAITHMRNQDNVRDRVTTSVVPITNVNRVSSLRMNSRPFAILASGLGGVFGRIPEHVRNIRYTSEFRYNNRDATNNSANQKIEDYSHSLDYQVLGVSLGADYKYQLTDDDIRALSDRRNDEWGLRISRPFTWSIWQVRLNPTAGYRHAVDKTIRGENYSRTQSTNFGLGITFGEFTVQTGYTISDVDRNQLASDVLTRQFTGSIGFRPVFVPDLNISFSFRHQDVTDQTPANSYRENETKAHVDYKF